MKILEFLQENNGALSSIRLFALFVIAGTMVDWMHAVFTTGVWKPDWQTIMMVIGVTGCKVIQKGEES